MKTHFKYRRVLIAITLLCSITFLHAQETYTITDSIVTQPSDDSSDDDEQTDEVFSNDSLVSHLRMVSYDTIASIERDKGFYYRRYMDSLLRATKFKKTERKVSTRSNFDFFDSIFGVFFWVLAIGLFIFLVYKLFLSNSSILVRNRKNLTSEIEMTEEETGDPDQLLKNAISAGNYRLAVRFLYLNTLQKLADRKIFELNNNKTNFEYANEVRNQPFANQFASLTLKYEYIWYGEYPVDESLFRQLQEDFNYFNKSISR